MRAVVPFDAEDPKTRLAGLLSPEERRAFARALLADVLDALEGAPQTDADDTANADKRIDGGLVDDESIDVEWPPTVVSTGPVDVDVPVAIEERGLDALVNDRLADGPLAVVMADLGLATPAALRRLFAADADVVLAPGRGGGTNALVVRDPSFFVDFHGCSLCDHRQIARDVGARFTEVDSMRLATDVDEPADLVELLLHGEGRAAAWLRERGFEVVVEEGRAIVER